MWLRGEGIGVPVCDLSLRKRASHSNLAQCQKCADVKKRWLALRTCKNCTLGNTEQMKREVFQHVDDVRRERQAAMNLHQQATQHSDWVYKYDDKCGSQF
eukprot:2745561-Pleurochrysis_carterae.AAC.1